MKYNFKYLMYRAAVYNNMLKFEVILIEHALNAFFNEFGAIVRRGDDGDFGQLGYQNFFLSFFANIAILKQSQCKPSLIHPGRSQTCISLTQWPLEMPGD
jgi:hypothetical protein